MNSMQKPKYEIKEPLPRIRQHEQLPPGTAELARAYDPNRKNKVFLFVRQGEYASILKADIDPRPLKDGGFIYTCGQADYPMGMLSWFSDALTESQKPPAKGGLHTGGMTGQDEEVDGEMLYIQRAMNAGPGVGGYVIVNRSRKSRLFPAEEHFEPQEVTFADNFL